MNARLETETENGPLGQSYITCIECGNNSRVTVNESQDVDLDDYWCRDCEEMHDPDDRYYEDDDRIDFADPGGDSALRAEHGVREGKCVKCQGKVDFSDQFCRHCGAEFNQRNRSCPDCGAENVLTPEDVALHYHCDRCSENMERGF